jgi:hypothetical protein
VSAAAVFFGCCCSRDIIASDRNSRHAAAAANGGNGGGFSNATWFSELGQCCHCCRWRYTMWNAVLSTGTPNCVCADVVALNKQLEETPLLTDDWTTWEIQAYNRSKLNVWGELKNLKCEDIQVEETHLITNPNSPLPPGSTVFLYPSVRMIPVRTSARRPQFTHIQDHLQVSFDLCFWAVEPAQQARPIQVVPTMCWVRVPAGFPFKFGLDFELR